jgi:hypothetical protein
MSATAISCEGKALLHETRANPSGLLLRLA